MTTTFTGPAATAGGPSLEPRRFVITDSRRETHDTRTLVLAPLDDAPLQFASGQFTMLLAHGVGEVPISISGDPAAPEILQHTVRDVGSVSHALVTAPIGTTLGVRGPFGVGWDVHRGRGGDVVIVAGGIGLAPIRPAVLEVCADRGSFGRVLLLYGARTPEEILFSDDLRAWSTDHDIDVEVIVDHGQHAWNGRVGLVTRLIERAHFDAENSFALVCGPEVMIRHAARSLTERGVSPGQIRVSMERSMKCGVGLCGHCQLRELFLCVDGPVLDFDRAAPLMARSEI